MSVEIYGVGGVGFDWDKVYEKSTAHKTLGRSLPTNDSSKHASRSKLISHWEGNLESL